MRFTFMLMVAGALTILGCGGPNEPKDNAPEPEKSKPASTSPTTNTSTEPAKKPEGPDPTAKKTAGLPKLTLKTPQGKSLTFSLDNDPWADRVVTYTPGKPQPKNSREPGAVIGKPDATSRKDADKFLALGFGGELIVEFTDNLLVDGPGDDLAIFALGNPLRLIAVAISTDGRSWVALGGLEGKKCTIDIEPAIQAGQQFRFVKITDAKSGKPNAAASEIDAIGAINSVAAKP